MLIGVFLKVGVMENGLVSPAEEGTPQGGPLSPLLSLWLVGPVQQLFPYRGPALLQVAREFSDFYAVDPRTPLICFDSLVSLPAVFPLADFFHQLLVTSWTFGFTFRRARFGPFPRTLGSRVCSALLSGPASRRV